MADLGNLYFDILLRDMTDKDIDRIKKKLEKIGVKIDADVNRNTLEKNIREALKNKTFEVNLEAGKNIKKAAIEANKDILTNSVSNTLKGKVFTADLKLAIKSATVQDAIKQSFAKAGLQYNTTASDVRAQRIAEIQQRMAIRAANAQKNLGNSYRYAANGAYESARASVVLGRSFHTNIRLAGELGTAMGNFASVFGIKDVLENLVQIGGQLENQRIALGAILQDGGKATEMFGKIQSLAVKSPFGIMDLNQYTKQLSAYGISYNELYDTMKRMADISAGVGADMGRIILAFGQVKAAGFLKGTELRQFTEANIPMVDKLAERFSNLEKRIVSAGEVYDMISKKKVTFEDVKSVLWDLTGEGGMFNNMQEVLSESLASKWKNLADAIDVMYGKIADGAIGGGLKNLAVFLTELTKNWEYLATAIGTASSAFIAYKASIAIGSGKGAYGVYNIIAANHQLEASNLRVASSYRALSAAEQGILATKGRYTTAELRQAAAAGVLTKEMTLRLIAMGKISVAQAGHLKQVLGITRAEIAAAAATSKWKVALAVFGNTLNGVWLTMKTMLLSPWTWAFAGITAITELFTYYGKKQDEIEERNKNFAESAKGSAETLERELLKIKDLDISKMNTDEMKIKVKELTTVIQNEADGWQSILSEIFAKEADGTFKNSVEEQLKLLKTKMDELAEAKKKLMGDNEMYSDVIGATETGLIFKDDVLDKIKEYNKLVDDNDKKLKQLGIHARDVSEALNYAIGGNESVSDELAGKSLNEQVALLSEYSDEWQKFITKLSETNPKAMNIANIWKANAPSKKDIEDSFKDAKKAMDNAFALKGEDINNFTERGRQAVYGFVDGVISETATQRPKMQQWLYDWWTGIYNIPRVDLDYIVPSQITGIGTGGDTGGSKKDAVAEMWKKRVAEIEKAVKIYDKWKSIEGKLFAENRVKGSEEFANLFNGAYGFNLDLESPTDAYEYIQKLLDSSKEKQKELMVNLGVKISDAEFNDAKTQLKDFLEKSKKFIDDTTKRWDLYKELFKATGDKSVSAKMAFGNSISFKDQLEQIKAEIKKEIKGSSISFEELISMSTEELEINGLARLKELVGVYNKESAKLNEESVKNFIKIIASSKDFAQQIEDIEGKLQKDLNDLRANAAKGGLSKTDLERREAELTARAEEEKSKVRFEEFKKSSDWVKVFDDLDRVSDATLDNMISKIEEFARQAGISEEVTKQLVEAMGKLRDENIERNPLQGFKDAWGRMRDIKDAFKRGQMDDGLFYLKQSNGTYKGLTEKELNDEQADANEDLKDSALAVADKFQAVANAANLLSGLFENLGIDLSGISDIFGGTASGAMTGAGLASAFGASGPWGAIAGAAVGMLSSVFAMHDKALQKEIEASEEREKAIKNMSDNLEGLLERTMGSIYTISLDKGSIDMLNEFLNRGNYWKDTSLFLGGNYYSEQTRKKAQEALRENSYYDAQLAALMAQRDEVQKQMQLEDEKKKTDKGKMEDYEKEIRELGVAIDEFAKDFADALYGINFKDWANQLTEAVVDAWSKGEDAATAYVNKVTELLRQVGVSAISQQFLQPLIEEQTKGFIQQFEKDNGKLTESSMQYLANIYNGAEKAVEYTEAYLEGLKKMDIDLSESSKDVSSGLSKGVQSVTEDTANLLGSYLNSIRHDSSVQRTLVEQLVSVDVPKMSIIAQAQLQQLQQVAANTKRNADAADRIYELVNKVVDKGGNKLRI